MEPDRRRLLQMMAAALVADTTPAAGPVKWSTGTELPKLKAPAHACDCHHYLYDSRYPVDRRGIMFPGNASIADYRALQRRLGITDRKSTRLNSSHGYISYAVFCLKKK